MSMPIFEPFTEWQDVPNPEEPPPGARMIMASDLNRYERGIRGLEERLDAYIASGAGTTDTVTAIDTLEPMQIVVYSDGTVKAIPASAEPAPRPEAPRAVEGPDYVIVSWSLPEGATDAALYRNGVQVYRGSKTRYRDTDVVNQHRYTYEVYAFTAHGWRSDASDAVDAGPDVSLNRAPTVTVSAWPNPLPATGIGTIRVSAEDADAQTLALSLGVDAGTITPTRDPAVWLYTANED